MKGWTYVRTYPVTDDFSWMHRLPNFLTHGALLRAFRAIAPLQKFYEEIMHDSSQFSKAGKLSWPVSLIAVFLRNHFAYRA